MARSRGRAPAGGVRSPVSARNRASTRASGRRGEVLNSHVLPRRERVEVLVHVVERVVLVQPAGAVRRPVEDPAGRVVPRPIPRRVALPGVHLEAEAEFRRKLPGDVEAECPVAQHDGQVALAGREVAAGVLEPVPTLLVLPVPDAGLGAHDEVGDLPAARTAHHLVGGHQQGLDERPGRGVHDVALEQPGSGPGDGDRVCRAQPLFSSCGADWVRVITFECPSTSYYSLPALSWRTRSYRFEYSVTTI